MRIKYLGTHQKKKLTGLSILTIPYNIVWTAVHTPQATAAAGDIIV